MLINVDFSSKTGILVVKFAFATANLKIETLRMRRRFARVLVKSLVLHNKGTLGTMGSRFWRLFLNEGPSTICRYIYLVELLAQYMAQRDELERLSLEMQELDREADELLAEFSVAADQYSRCAGAA